MAQAAQMVQGGALGFLGVGQQAAGGADGQGQFLATEAFQILGRKLLAEALEGAVAVEIPGCATAHATAFFQRQAGGPVIGDHQFGGVQALDFGQQGFPTAEFLHAEAATGDVQHRESEESFIADHGGEQIVAMLVEQCFVAHRAGGDDAHHLTLHRALAGSRIADLLADHHRFAELHQAA